MSGAVPIVGETYELMFHEAPSGQWVDLQPTYWLTSDVYLSEINALTNCEYMKCSNTFQTGKKHCANVVV